MKRPSLLGIRRPVFFESALRDADEQILRLAFRTLTSAPPAAASPWRLKLVEAELARRKASATLGLLATITFFLTLVSLTPSQSPFAGLIHPLSRPVFLQTPSSLRSSAPSASPR